MTTMPDHAATGELLPPDPPAFPYRHAEFERFIGSPDRRWPRLECGPDC